MFSEKGHAPHAAKREPVVLASDKLHTRSRRRDHISKMMSNVGIALQEYILASPDPPLNACLVLGWKASVPFTMDEQIKIYSKIAHLLLTFYRWKRE